ncbi:PQQ-dependent sugar dehydrogenase [Bordetella genomosp. 11]|uniref:Dehydrogenase n=1 Tax=Bordetella genomosp. 11 TaxID=1416808 RepID=A0A261UKD5_9BORD|nr:PQQ-dependent sugar dehydrogenase [Bordetella genomosp. 11]OZI61730.1 dehydrogenase [Bordetella genomosp. 11]
MQLARITLGGIGVILAATLGIAAGPTAAIAETNAGQIKPRGDKPFAAAPVATFDEPWAIGFLPDGRMLVTEKPGRIFLVDPHGRKTPVAGVPKVAYGGQNGLLDIAAAPDYPASRAVYFTYMEPGAGGSSLALARARLEETGARAALRDVSVIWRQAYQGAGGQPGGIIAFSPDGRHLFLTVGDRMSPETAQDPDLPLGKVLRLNPDGSTPADNPWFAQGGVRAQTWTTGHRNPYGLAFAPDGRLWMDEMGPKGGDELNLILRGRNYGWPIVSNGDNYNGTPIPRHATRPEFEAPVIYWTPVIAPAGLAFYTGPMFPQWQGSAFIGGLRARALARIAFDGRGGATQADLWDMGQRIRDVAVAPDGALWVIEDASDGRLLRLTPKK